MKTCVIIFCSCFLLWANARAQGHHHKWERGFSDQYKTENTLGQYAFGYNEDHTSGGSFRREAGDRYGNKIGSYGLRIADGRIRIVNYVADHNGYRADVMTNEPGISTQKANGYLEVSKKGFHGIMIPGFSYSAEAPHVSFSQSHIDEPHINIGEGHTDESHVTFREDNIGKSNLPFSHSNVEETAEVPRKNKVEDIRWEDSDQDFHPVVGDEKIYAQASTLTDVAGAESSSAPKTEEVPESQGNVSNEEQEHSSVAEAPVHPAETKVTESAIEDSLISSGNFTDTEKK